MTTPCQPPHPASLPASVASAPDPSMLPLYESIRIDDVLLVRSPADESTALQALMASAAIGFDTESKPTFAKGEVSDGPHLVQFATDDQAFLFAVSGGPASQVLKTVLESTEVLKVGFGLRDDLRRLQSKLGIGSANVLDLAIALRQGKRGDVGAKTAVARLFGQRLQKSKKTSTTNWSSPRLSERQLLYAANDAQVALRVYLAWRHAEGGNSPKPQAGPKAEPNAEPVRAVATGPGLWHRFWSHLRPRPAAKTDRHR